MYCCYTRFFFGSLLILPLSLLQADTQPLPNTTLHQGRLLVDGANITATVGMEFLIYEGPNGPIPDDGEASPDDYWARWASPVGELTELRPDEGTLIVEGEEAPVSIEVTQGLFQAPLGDTALKNMEALPEPLAPLFSGNRLYLRIWVTIKGERQWLGPDQEINPVLFAVLARKAQGIFDENHARLLDGGGKESFITHDSLAAPSLGEIAFGRFNLIYSPDSEFGTFDPDNRIFSIGAGTSSLRFNAFTVFKSGDTLVGRNLTVPGNIAASSDILVSDDINIGDDLIVNDDLTVNGIAVMGEEKVNGTSSLTDVEVSGFVLNSGDYLYRSARTRYLQVPASQFVPQTNMENYALTTAGYLNVNSGTRIVAVAPVNLPDEARVTEFRAFLYDNSSINNLLDVDVILRSQSISSTSTTTMASIVNVSSSNASSGIRNFLDNTITSGTINNSSQRYYITLDFRANASSLVRFYGARITYTVSEAD